MEKLEEEQAATLGASVADLINYLGGDVETQVLEGIKTVNPDLCEQIKEKMFIFENLNEMDDRSLQLVLRNVESNVLLIALKGADDRVKNKIFSNMSSRAAELMKDDLDAQSPVKISEVEMAQKEVLAAARKLAEAGEITLASKGGEAMI